MRPVLVDDEAKIMEMREKLHRVANL